MVQFDNKFYKVEWMLEEIAPNLSIQRHPLSLVGCKMGRVVTLIRLNSGKVLIHSTAQFNDEDISEIRKFGEPAWLLEVTNFHDTFAQEGRVAFSTIPYFTPSGFADADLLKCTSMDSLPEEWVDELEVIKIEGMPKIQEHIVYHRQSKTLIVADLLFNIQPEAGWWTHTFLRATAGIREYPGMSRLYRLFIKDRSAFIKSMQNILALDFENIVMSHGDPILGSAKSILIDLLDKHDLSKL